MYNKQNSLLNLRLGEVNIEKLLPRFAIGIAIAFLLLLALRVSYVFLLIATHLGWSQWVAWSIYGICLAILLGGITYFVRHFLLRWWR